MEESKQIIINFGRNEKPKNGDTLIYDEKTKSWKTCDFDKLSSPLAEKIAKGNEKITRLEEHVEKLRVEIKNLIRINKELNIK